VTYSIVQIRIPKIDCLLPQHCDVLVSATDKHFISAPLKVKGTDKEKKLTHAKYPPFPLVTHEARCRLVM
jgi:hypothetical protein